MSEARLLAEDRVAEKGQERLGRENGVEENCLPCRWDVALQLRVLMPF